jgi:hypothetical protein
MPDDGDLDQLLQNLAAERGRPISVLEHDPQADGLPSGLWIKATHGDIIMVEAGAGPSRRAVILSHEIAHMMLGHDGDCEASDLVVQGSPNLNQGLIERVLHRDNYATDDEGDAEEVATLIAVEHGRRRRNAELRSNPISARLR